MDGTLASKMADSRMRIKKMGQVFTGVGLLVEYLFCDMVEGVAVVY